MMFEPSFHSFLLCLKQLNTCGGADGTCHRALEQDATVLEKIIGKNLKDKKEIMGRGGSLPMISFCCESAVGAEQKNRCNTG